MSDAATPTAKWERLVSCPSHNMLPHPGTRLCPLYDGDEVFGGNCLRGSRAHRVAGSRGGEQCCLL